MPWTALPLSIINSAAAPNTQTNPQTTLSIPCPSVHRSARITNQYHPYQQMHRWCSNIQTLHFQKYPLYVSQPKEVAALFINNSLSNSDGPCHDTAFPIMSAIIAVAVAIPFQSLNDTQSLEQQHRTTVLQQITFNQTLEAFTVNRMHHSMTMNTAKQGQNIRTLSVQYQYRTASLLARCIDSRRQSVMRDRECIFGFVSFRHSFVGEREVLKC